MNRITSYFKYFDLVILGSSFMLLFLGLLMIYSTSLEGSNTLLFRQIIFAAAGLLIMFSVSLFDYRSLKRATPWLYLGIIFILLLVLFIGPTIRGSSRWINLGFFRFQPAEFAKIVAVIIMAKFLDQQGEKIKAFRYVLLSLLYVSVPVALILMEPDLGSALVVFFTWLAMIMFSKINKKHLVMLLAGLIIIASLFWVFGIADYQKQRIFTFLDPGSDPQGQGYNVIQSIIAVGSGEIFGRGLGRGLQSQLKFLPERQTDFIFASTAEELGMLGSLVILILFFVIFFRIIRTVATARDNFGMYLSLGILFMLLIQVVINVGMNVGIMPVTGIPLPLLSYGGSSLITTFISIGLIQSIIARKNAVRF